METLVKDKRYTYADYRNLDVDDNYYYEFIDGELGKKSAPSPRQQMVLAYLFRKMDTLVLEKIR